MVQNSGGEPKRRGRPRAYDPDIAIGQVVEAFWSAGYAGTSLDEISAATGMNRPSLYAAFGDKRGLYLKALQHYWRRGGAAMREALAGDGPLDEVLMKVYAAALDVYFSGAGLPRGCFAIGTATAEAVDEPEIRAAFAAGLTRLDGRFEARIRLAQERGELAAGADPATLAILASATLHTIAIRSRSGTSRDELMALARKAVGVICGKQVSAAS
jgi:TetR/AcrR family transcriptional regulator, copper-responsive repressor